MAGSKLNCTCICLVKSARLSATAYAQGRVCVALLVRCPGVTVELHCAVTVRVSTARKAPARSSGVGNAATMSRVTLVAASGLTATGAKLWSGHLQSVWGIGVCTDLVRIILYRATNCCAAHASQTRP